MTKNSLMVIQRSGNKSKGRRRSNVPPKGSKRSEYESDSIVNVYYTKNGKKFTTLTTHGKFVRNKMELRDNVNIFTGKELTDYQRGKRAGFNQALGEQARSYNYKNKHGE